MVRAGLDAPIRQADARRRLVVGIAGLAAPVGSSRTGIASRTGVVARSREVNEPANDWSVLTETRGAD